MLVLLSTLAAVPAAGNRYIDPMPSYQPQTKCSPTVKRGTLELAGWLQKAYPGSGSLGIVRSCSSGGTSEHKEGRAFDWALDASNPRDRRYAQGFLRRIRATDKVGNTDALARRMGVMYAIFNDKIYSASYGYAPRPYLNAGCAHVRGCSPTLRHRDHMHISLTWAGALGRTSWYKTSKHHAGGGHNDSGNGGNGGNGGSPGEPHDGNGGGNGGGSSDQSPIPPREPGTPDAPALTFAQRDAVTLRAQAGERTQTRFALEAGRTYKVTTWGLTQYGAMTNQVADAACSWNPRTGSWQPRVPRQTRKRYGALDLRMNGRAIFGSDCHGGKHIYTALVTPERTRTVTFTLDQKAAPAGTRAPVVVSRVSHRAAADAPTPLHTNRAPAAQAPVVDDAAGTLRDSFAFGSRDRYTFSPRTLDAGVTYQITMTGVMEIAPDVFTDGQCTAVEGRWQAQGTINPYQPGADHGNVYLSGAPFDGVAPAEDPTGCTTHQHTLTYTPAVTTRLHVAMWDPTGLDDNEGALTLTIDRATRVPAPAPGPVETPRRSEHWTDRSETVTVPSSSTGVLSAMKVRSGEEVTVRVWGTFIDGDAVRADASCVLTGWWAPNLGSATGQDVLALTVDGGVPDWTPVGGGTCSDRWHQYEATLRPTKSGSLRFGVLDSDPSDNRGDLTVRLSRQ